MDSPWDESWHLPYYGIYAQHSVYQRPIIDKLLVEHDVSAIFELGTAKGALAVYLGPWGLLLDVPVYSFDCAEPDPNALKLMTAMGVTFRQCDVFSEEVSDYILDRCLSPVYMICDNGNKPMEMQYYSKRLPKGSLISAHDWGVEIMPEEVVGLPLEPVNSELWTWNNVRFATWKVT